MYFTLRRRFFFFFLWHLRVHLFSTHVPPCSEKRPKVHWWTVRRRPYFTFDVSLLFYHFALSVRTIRARLVCAILFVARKRLLRKSVGIYLTLELSWNAAGLSGSVNFGKLPCSMYSRNVNSATVCKVFTT